MIDRRLMLKFEEWFENYVSKFSSPDENIQINYNIKKEHTFKVCGEIINIGKSLNLSREDLFIAETIALFHDLGRFEQYKIYGTFSDEKSLNHSELAISILDEYSVLKELKEKDYLAVINSILNHNRLEINKTDDEKTAFFSRMIRDADKLDIYRLFLHYQKNNKTSRNDTIELNLSKDDNVSDLIYSDILNGKIIRYSDLKTSNDFKLLRLSWIYDLNFLYSFNKIRRKNYIGLLFEQLPQEDGRINLIFKKINSFIDEKCCLSN